MAIDFRVFAFGLVVAGGILVSMIATSLSDPESPRKPAAGPAPVSQAVASMAPSSSALPKVTAQPSVPAKTAVATLPPNHPALPRAAPALPPASGKAGAAAAPAANYTHFRIGERNVKRILVDGDRVWVGTSGGVVRYTPATDEFKLYDIRAGLKAAGITHVGRLHGRIAVGTLGGGLSILDGQTDQWETFGVADGLPDAVVHDVLQASNGDVWIATPSGVVRVRGGSLRDRGNWSQFAAAGDQQGLPSDRVYALAEGRNGDIWTATEAGVAVYRNGGWRHWPNAGGQGGSGENFIVAVSVDRAGIVWAGTLGGGLLRFDGAKWRRYMLADGLPGDHVFTLHQDAGNRLWVGTNNGLARMKDGKFAVMTKQDGLYSNSVFAMASSPGTLWVGSYGGVARIRTNN